MYIVANWLVGLCIFFVIQTIMEVILIVFFLVCVCVFFFKLFLVSSTLSVQYVKSHVTFTLTKSLQSLPTPTPECPRLLLLYNRTPEYSTTMSLTLTRLNIGISASLKEVTR